ncbi:uncharacterized protein N7482_001778 [Penicillium canariense]|uniref:Secreted protein n=1 Tax=Penicillium canariense TaxID=189055 RepID=A0A9W9IKD1_9EURO|nr:uncharacterized protein N7482_001778 [Penicillium canariense]KAJ5175901.1 hypothetical protein N7482_001778 [Penicillium canariense]
MLIAIMMLAAAAAAAAVVIPLPECASNYPMVDGAEDRKVIGRESIGRARPSKDDERWSSDVDSHIGTFYAELRWCWANSSDAGGCGRRDRPLVPPQTQTSAMPFAPKSLSHPP